MKYMLISPNTLTISRIILTVFFILFISAEGFFAKLCGALIFGLASFTDFYDGYMAKKHNLVSDFGKLMDPIADKFLMLSAFLMFTKMGLVSVFAFLVIFLREVLITAMRLYAKTKGYILSAEKLGKYKTVSQVIAAGFILLYIVLGSSNMGAKWDDVTITIWEDIVDFLMMVVILLTLASGIVYVINNKRVFDRFND